MNLRCSLGPAVLATPLVAASGTVGSVDDFEAVGSLGSYGAAVAKSVAPEPWPGRRVPRMGPAGVGMLNGIGIQNPGIDAWVEAHSEPISALDVPVWGSAVGGTPEDFALVAKGLRRAGVAAVEVNLSCPNIEGKGIFALDPASSASVVAAVRAAVDMPVSAKLSPNAENIAAIASAVTDAGADWVVLTNTALGARIDVETRRPVLSGTVGGYSGPPIKPLVMRCVIEVHEQLPDVPILACGGVSTGEDVVEYLMAGAAAVAIGTAHFAEPRVGRRVLRELRRWMRRHRIDDVQELIGTMERW